MLAGPFRKKKKSVWKSTECKLIFFSERTTPHESLKSLVLLAVQMRKKLFKIKGARAMGGAPAAGAKKKKKKKKKKQKQKKK